LERHPWLAMNLYKAFEEAKRRSVERLSDITASHAPLAWLAPYAERMKSLFGEDIWPYGLEKNRTTLQAFVDFAFEQGVCHRRQARESGGDQDLDAHAGWHLPPFASLERRGRVSGRGDRSFRPRQPAHRRHFGRGGRLDGEKGCQGDGDRRHGKAGARTGRHHARGASYRTLEDPQPARRLAPGVRRESPRGVRHGNGDLRLRERG